MALKRMDLDEYESYITSTVAFMEMWRECHIALLSNPEYLGKESWNAEKLLDISFQQAEELKRGLSQYLEGIQGRD